MSAVDHAAQIAEVLAVTSGCVTRNGVRDKELSPCWRCLRQAEALVAAGIGVLPEIESQKTEHEYESVWHGCRCGHPGLGCCCTSTKERTGRTRSRTRYAEHVTEWEPTDA